ncbi:MAG: hypothetical protein Q8O56_05250 [Solirubrobacteraceae bacterium]|nr:hypothetical protein [Solirubrobacteraceae bacterium]
MAMTIVELPARGLSLELPLGSDVTCETPLLLLLPAIDGLRPWVVLTRAPTAADSLQDWVAEELARQDGTLQIPLLLAYDDCELFGLPALRTLIGHAAGEHAMTLVQWWALLDGHGILAAASCVTPHYHLVAAQFEQIVTTGVRFDDDR